MGIHWSVLGVGLEEGVIDSRLMRQNMMEAVAAQLELLEIMLNRSWGLTQLGMTTKDFSGSWKDNGKVTWIVRKVKGNITMDSTIYTIALPEGCC